MNDAFSTVLKSALQYQQKQVVITSIGIIICLIIITCFGIAQYKKASATNKILIISIISLFSILFVVNIVHGKLYNNKILSDISDEGYIYYSGEYIHDDYQKDSFWHNLYILDDSDKKLILRFPDYANQYQTHNRFDIMPTGTYEGTIVYSKRSKIVVSWSIE